jgi:hypothetical protein
LDFSLDHIDRHTHAGMSIAEDWEKTKKAALN